MSLATRCPHCDTVFRVSHAQLAAARGWVRCGACAQVFEGPQHLLPDDPLAAPFQELPDIDLELPDLSAQPTAAADPVGSRQEPAWAEPPPTTEATAASGMIDAAPQPESAVEDSIPAFEPYTPAAQASPDPLPATSQPTEPQPVADMRWPVGHDLREPSRPAESAEPSSAAAARDAAAPSGTGRWISVLGVMALLGLALLQGVYGLRGHIAEWWPPARPVLTAACQALGCRMPALLRADALVVQSVSLSHDGETGHHRLRVLLFNAADAPVAAPALELSLIDAQGQTLARKVLLASDMEPPLTDLEPQSTLESGVTLDLRGLEAATIGTFRLVAFHP